MKDGPLLLTALASACLLLAGGLMASRRPTQPSSDAIDERTVSALRLLVQQPEPMAMLWPLPGHACEHWTISFDLAGEGSGSVRDKHDGIDIVPLQTTRNMPVRSLRPGRVVRRHDGEVDHALPSLDALEGCEASANSVTILHDNGVLAHYGHLRRNSVAVALHQQVERGDVLGLVGSSGCSTGPHLHLELHDQNMELLDPLSPAWSWAGPRPEDSCESAVARAAVVPHDYTPHWDERPPHHDTLLVGAPYDVLTSVVGEPGSRPTVTVRVFDSAQVQVAENPRRLSKSQRRVRHTRHGMGHLYRPGDYTVEVWLDGRLDQILDLSLERTQP